jgi:hypothetical protein
MSDFTDTRINNTEDRFFNENITVAAFLIFVIFTARCYDIHECNVSCGVRDIIKE